MAQGCPGAPLLFVFAEEPLSCELQRRLTGIPVAIPGQNSQVALGADDVMILCGNREDIKESQQVVEE